MAEKTIHPFRRAMLILGSLKFALILLSVIIVATAYGTYLESDKGYSSAEVARRVVYENPLFTTWLLMLCVNLFAAAASRYPWKPHQTGFVITHAGIIILLIGGVVDKIWGFEGFVHLYRGQGPRNIMEMHEEQFEVYVDRSDETDAPAFTNIKLRGYKDQTTLRIPINSPTRDVSLELIDSRPVRFVDQDIVVPSEKGVPAIKVRLQGGMMGVQELEPLIIGDVKNAGPATFSFLPGMPEPPKPPRHLAPPPADATGWLPWKEKITVFFLHPDQLTISTKVKEPSGVDAVLDVKIKKGEKPDVKLHLALFDKKVIFDVKELFDKRGQELAIEGLPTWKLKFLNFYPNYKIGEDGPTSMGSEPENPAAEFELIGPLLPPEDFKAVAESKGKASPHGGGDGGHAAPTAAPNSLTIYLGEDKKLRYVVKSRKSGEKTGEIQPGERVAVDWAKDTEFILEEFLPTAVKRNEPGYKPLSASQSKGGKTMDGFQTGVLLRVKVGAEKVERWIVQTQSIGQLDVGDKPRSERFEIAGRVVDVFFTARTRRLPFQVSLLNFSAPHQEGLENSSNFMDYQSTLSFDGRKDSLTLKPNTRSAGLYGTTDLTGAITNEDDKVIEMQVEQLLTVPKDDIQYVMNADAASSDMVLLKPGSKLNDRFRGLISGFLKQNAGGEGLEGARAMNNAYSMVAHDFRKEGVRDMPIPLVDVEYMDLDRNRRRSADQIIDLVQVKPTSAYYSQFSGLLVGEIKEQTETAVIIELRNRQVAKIPVEEVANHEKRTHKIYMNYPTTYPESALGPWIGSTYKLSQANHSVTNTVATHNPNYSGVQILFDPGWLPKWVGCVLICFGIFTMFYLKPYFNRRPAKSAEVADAAKKKPLPPDNSPRVSATPQVSK